MSASACAAADRFDLVRYEPPCESGLGARQPNGVMPGQLAPSHHELEQAPRCRCVVPGTSEFLIDGSKRCAASSSTRRASPGAGSRSPCRDRACDWSRPACASPIDARTNGRSRLMWAFMPRRMFPSPETSRRSAASKAISHAWRRGPGASVPRRRMPEVVVGEQRIFSIHVRGIRKEQRIGGDGTPVLLGRSQVQQRKHRLVVAAAAPDAEPARHLRDHAIHALDRAPLAGGSGDDGRAERPVSIDAALAPVMPAARTHSDARESRSLSRPASIVGCSSLSSPPSLEPCAD